MSARHLFGCSFRGGLVAAFSLMLSLSLHSFLVLGRPLWTTLFGQPAVDLISDSSLRLRNVSSPVILDGGRLTVRVDARTGQLEVTTSRHGILVARSSLASPYVRSGGALQKLRLNSVKTRSGCDSLGCFIVATLDWRLVHPSRNDTVPKSATTAVRAYVATDTIVFSQHFPTALHGTGSGRPCGFIGGPAANLFNDCGLASAFPRLTFGPDYRRWLSWTGGGNSPEPAFGSLDAMVGQAAFVKEGSGGTVARGILTLAYEGRARAARPVQQDLDAISLQPPWGKGAPVNYARAKAWCLSERRCRGFVWQSPALGEASRAIEPDPGTPGRWQFVTDTPARGGPPLPLAFYGSAAATNLGGLVAAPIALPYGRSLNDTIAITALSSVMSASHEYDVEAGSLDLGVLGSVTSLHAGYTAEWLLTVDSGFHGALRKAGAALLQKAGTAQTKRSNAAADVSLNSLGYATQQGAWYYYNTAPQRETALDGAAQPSGTLPARSASFEWDNTSPDKPAAFGCAANVSDPPAQRCKSYSETLVDVRRRADEVSLPYRWLLMDSWWYQKGSLSGVQTWDALPSTFPGTDGRGGDRAIDQLAHSTGWQIVAHTRFFGADTTYAVQNGGAYDFVIERGRYSTHPVHGGLALPSDERFWQDLLRNKTRAIPMLAGVEIDWM